MEARETDFQYVQPQEVVDAQVDGIAGGILDQLENKDPDHSGVAVPREATEEESTPRVEPEEEEETEEAEEAGEEPEKYSIKWQGQEQEVTQDQLFDLAQKGFDYTQKTQALAQERDNLAPYQGLANRIKSDPQLASRIAELLSGKAPQQEPVRPQFEDPIEQLKWETKQETLAEVRQEMQRNLTPLHRQQALNQVKAQVQADPDYTKVHGVIMGQVMALPGASELMAELQKGQNANLRTVRNSLAKNTYLQLDQDPQSYLEAFQHYKKQMAPGSLTIPKPVKKETRAPILESGGMEPAEGIRSKGKAERLSKQKAAALRSGDPLAIADWLQDSGAIDHLY